MSKKCLGVMVFCLFSIRLFSQDFTDLATMPRSILNEEKITEINVVRLQLVNINKEHTLLINELINKLAERDVLRKKMNDDEKAYLFSLISKNPKVIEDKNSLQVTERDVEIPEDKILDTQIEDLQNQLAILEAEKENASKIIDTKEKDVSSPPNPKLKPLKFVGGLDINFNDNYPFVPVAAFEYNKNWNWGKIGINSFGYAVNVKINPFTARGGTEEIADFYEINGGSIEVTLNTYYQKLFSESFGYKFKLNGVYSYLNSIDTSIANSNRKDDHYLKVDAVMNLWLEFAYVGVMATYIIPAVNENIISEDKLIYKGQICIPLKDDSYLKGTIATETINDFDKYNFQIGYATSLSIF